MRSGSSACLQQTRQCQRRVVLVLLWAKEAGAALCSQPGNLSLRQSPALQARHPHTLADSCRPCPWSTAGTVAAIPHTWRVLSSNAWLRRGGFPPGRISHVPLCRQSRPSPAELRLSRMRLLFNSAGWLRGGREGVKGSPAGGGPQLFAVKPALPGL